MDTRLTNYYANRLEQIFLYITDKCSFGCKHCLIGDRDNHFYTLDELQIILDTIRSNGGTKVTLLGGEPTEHPQLMEIIALAKSMHYEVVLDTCGSFPPTFFDNEDFVKIDTICFSVDGHNASVHDTIRIKGSFDQIMEQIKLAKQNDIKIKFTHTVNKTNLEFMLDIISLAIELEIDELNFHVATYNGRAKFVKDPGIVSPAEWYATYQKIRRFIGQKNPQRPELRIPPRYCTPTDLDKFFADHKCVAYLGDRMLIVPQDETKGDLGGPLYACGLLIGEQLTLGWNVTGNFVFNKSNEGEFAKYYEEEIPSVNGIPICPIVSKDSGNLNFLENKSLIPLCISYKPPLDETNHSSAEF